MRLPIKSTALGFFLLLNACASSQRGIEVINSPSTPTSTLETKILTYETPSIPQSSYIPSSNLHPQPTKTPMADWRVMPVYPVISQNAKSILAYGQTLGRDIYRFSKVGDCQNINTFFLAEFDYPARYNLGSYAYLETTIDWYNGSFDRKSFAVRGGFNAAAQLTPFMADREVCNIDEGPMACEYRLYNPSVAIISLEEWYEGAGDPSKYEGYMRKILDYTISQGILPILVTKADNHEGNNTINNITAKLAWEYDIPLWNFWGSVQNLPSKGLTSDNFHLTQSPLNQFDLTDENLIYAWPVRNLGALQALDAVRSSLDK